MNKYDDKICALEKHLNAHPTDYQARISLFKNRSGSVIYDRNHRKNMMQKEIAKYKKAGEFIGK